MIFYSRHCVEKIMNICFDSTKVKWFALYHTNLSHEVPLSFVWLKFSSFGWDVDMRRIRSDNTIRLGIPKASQGNIQGRSKQLSLGMPRKASPLSSPTLSVTSVGAIFSFVTWSVFCLEHHFILLGFAWCYLEQFSASFISIKMSRIAFTMLNCKYMSCCCKNFREKSECDKMFKFLYDKLW